MPMHERRMPLLTAKNAVVEDVEGSNMPLGRANFLPRHFRPAKLYIQPRD
jgi:hypothetical protein